MSKTGVVGLTQRQKANSGAASRASRKSLPLCPRIGEAIAKGANAVLLCHPAFRCVDRCGPRLPRVLGKINSNDEHLGAYSPVSGGRHILPIAFYRWPCSKKPEDTKSPVRFTQRLNCERPRLFPWGARRECSNHLR